LLAVVPIAILPRMFMVSEEDAAAIRATFDNDGELSAAIELRRRCRADQSLHSVCMT
jgi:hypothetical protein